jgi:hypothetical protein
MEYKSVLKSNAWVDVQTLADWLKIKTAKLDVSSSKASLIVGDITFTFASGGIEGNSFNVELIPGAVAGGELIVETSSLLSIQIEDGVSTAQQIQDAIISGSLSFITSEISGTASNAQSAVASTPLANGTDPNSDNAKLVKKLERFLNYAHDKIESIIDTPVLPRTYVEEQDGNSSNTLVPSQWPVQSIEEIRIDYNRGFSDPTLLAVENFFLRGTPDRRQKVTDTAVRIIGNDVVLRDDNEKFIVGRIFAGSALGSIRITYKAGWSGEAVRITDDVLGSQLIDAYDVPQDLALAAIQLSEWFYYQRENRDLGVTGKGVVGENYSKTTDGIPNQIYDLVMQYTDCSFGTHNFPQRNVWGFDDL